VRFYGNWIREEAEKLIGNLYSNVEVTAEMAEERIDLTRYVGRKLPVVAYLWVRTVKSPDPAFGQVYVPLASTFTLANKPGKEAYVKPVLVGDAYSFSVKVGKGAEATAATKGTKHTGRGSNFSCVMSGTPITGDYIKAEAKAGRMDMRLMAIVAEGNRGRVYLSPTSEVETAARSVIATWRPDVEISGSTQYLGIKPYGMDSFADLFTERQLVALSTFSELLEKVHETVRKSAITAGLHDDAIGIASGGNGATAYAEAIEVYLGFILSRVIHYGSALCTWLAKDGAIARTFTRQALTMSWDFAEGNPFEKSSTGWKECTEVIAKVLGFLPEASPGQALMADAAESTTGGSSVIVSTDPPYYDNVPYADLSDFFYVWLRKSLKSVYPSLFETVAVPKTHELVAFAYRHGNKDRAEAFFLEGMTKAMHSLAGRAHPAFPVTIYYAFRQSESEVDIGTASTGWQTFLEAVIRAGFVVSGTWPLRTEGDNRQRSVGTNALASSIVLVCRPQESNAPTATRREFLGALKSELPGALKLLQRGNIAPVDLAQAAIGPGMAVYTRYAKVLDASGEAVSVREALALINQVLDEALAEQEGDFDADTRWALVWFEHSGFESGEYGVAETLSKAKNTSVAGMVNAKFLSSRGGKVRLLRPDELAADWNPATDSRLTAWEVVHQLIRVLEAGGEGAAAELVTKLGSKAEPARELAYRLYTICERKKRAPQALSYNALVQSWPEITRLAAEAAKHFPQPKQTEFELT
jgi:putative DNA methylase